jgi:diacylglycerol kinase family enzyme
MATWKPANFTVRLDGGETIGFAGYSVAAANSKAFGAGMFLAPDASLEDGLLDVVMIKHIPRLRYLQLLPRVFDGSHVRVRAVQIVRAHELEISASRPFTMYADGDPLADLPVTVRALRRAIRVLVPRDTPPARREAQ